MRGTLCAINMLNKISIKILLIIFSVALLIIRFFYFQLDKVFGVLVLDIFGLTLLAFTVLLLVLTVRQAIKKKFKSIIIFVVIVALFLFFPFEYLIGWTQFQFNNGSRKEKVTSLKKGSYDSILSKLDYPKYGAWIENQNPRFKIFKDSSLQLVFIWQGYIRTHEEYCGMLYISDNSQISDKRIYDFLGREFRKTSLGSNWYWVDCFIDRTPAP